MALGLLHLGRQGHHPRLGAGGGAEPRCTETGTVLPDGVVQTDTHKSAFFYDAATGAKLGQWVLPRPQTIEENCTIHSYNVVPSASAMCW